MSSVLEAVLQSDLFRLLLEDAGSRFFYLNFLGAALVVAISIWSSQYLRRLRARQSLLTQIREFFSMSYWWNASTRVDYALIGINAAFRGFLAGPLALAVWWLTRFEIEALRFLTGSEGIGWGLSPIHLFVSALIAFVFDDGLRYLHHRAMHEISYLSRFHRTHHSASVLTPLTLLRVHPVEVVLAGFRNALSASVVTAVFVFCFNQPLTLWTFFGVNAFAWLFNFFGAQLRHSHIEISFGPLEKIFISPFMHQMHHRKERKLSRSNYGVSLAVWDWLADTLVTTKELEQLESVHLEMKTERGVGRVDPGSLRAALLLPNKIRWRLEMIKGLHCSARENDVVRVGLSVWVATLIAVVSVFALWTSKVGAQVGSANGSVSASPLVVLTDRPGERLTEFTAGYLKRTGEQPTIVSVPNAEDAVGSAQTQGQYGQADLILVKDLAIAQRLIEAKAVRPFHGDIPVIAAGLGVLEALVDRSEGYFVGLTARVRAIAYSEALPETLLSGLQTYADLGTQTWSGRLCLRTSDHDYNRVLMGGLITRLGDIDSTVRLIQGWVQNLAQPPNRNDRSILQDIANGVCDVGVVNHYYWANEKDQNPQFPVGFKILDKGRGGALVNGSLVLLGAKSRASAAQIKVAVEALLSERSQLQMSAAHNELPSVAAIEPATPYARALWPLERNGEDWARVRQNLGATTEAALRSGYR